MITIAATNKRPVVKVALDPDCASRKLEGKMLNTKTLMTILRNLINTLDLFKCVRLKARF